MATAEGTATACAELVGKDEAATKAESDAGLLRAVLDAWHEGRMKDALASLALLGATAPLLWFMALLIKTSDPEFKVLKFRSLQTKPVPRIIPEQFSQSDFYSEEYYDLLVDNTADPLIETLADVLHIPERRRLAFRQTIKDFAEAERSATTRAKAKPRPKWEDRKGADAKLSPPEFIAKHYATEMAAGTLHRGVIAQEDKALAVKLANWLRTHPMPGGIDIPTLPEWNTRQLAKPDARAVLRLAAVARKRRERTTAPG